MHYASVTPVIRKVSEICKLCNAEGIPLIPHGTGTGMENGVSAVRGGMCVDLTKMSGIEDYHPDDFDVSVRPGVTREDLNHFVKDGGLMFTVDPGTSQLQFQVTNPRFLILLPFILNLISENWAKFPQKMLCP